MMSIAMNAYGMPCMTFGGSLFAAPRQAAIPAEEGVLCAVRLYSRRTGRPYRIGDTTFTVYTRIPGQTVADLLGSHDPAIWEARIEAVPDKGRVA